MRIMNVCLCKEPIESPAIVCGECLEVIRRNEGPRWKVGDTLYPTTGGTVTVRGIVSPSSLNRWFRYQCDFSNNQQSGLFNESELVPF